MNFDFENSFKNDCRIITKNHEADSELGFLTRSPVLELKNISISGCLKMLFSKTKISYPRLDYWTLSKNLRALLADYSRNSL